MQNTTVKTPKRPLLQTKLVMPRQRLNVVVRPRLCDLLNTAVTPDGAIHPKLTLITGAAGYGKTTLTIQWASQLNHPVAWLSLDSGDNDEARFLAYLFAAVGTIQEEIGEAALSRLSSAYIYNDAEAILTAFLNDLATCAETVLLVLDDYHLITADAVHQTITFILQHMPVQLHLVITSRTEPPLPVALLRARDALNWINARDLRFAPEEAAQFLTQTMGVQLTAAQVNQLDEQVEGWVTGLQLAALALQEEAPLEQAFSGSQRYLVDYLGDQVLDRQPAEIQAFLLGTAVLDRFCAPLCDALLEIGDWRLEIESQSHELLDRIDSANLFLIPLDAERQWYRYHHLFADFLVGRLQRCKTAADIAQLHQQAALWYQAHGQPLAAVDHALAAADYPLAAELMVAVSREVLMFGEGSALRQWVESLPAELQTSRRRLSLFYAWSLIRTGALTQATAVLEAVADQLDTPLLWGEWSALRARVAVMTGDTDVSIRFSQKALHKLPPDQHMLRSEVSINLGFSHLQQADLEAAREAFAEAAQNSSHDPGLWAVMFATFYWGQTYERQAQLPAAFDIYQRGLEIAQTQTNGRTPSPAVGFMHVGLGGLFYEWNRLAEAETHLRHALTFAKRCGDHKMLIYARGQLAQYLAAVSDWQAAFALIDDLEQQIQAASPTIRRATLALQQGDTLPVQQWASQLGIALTDSPEKFQEWPTAYLELVRLHLAQREFQGTLPALQMLADVADTRHNTHFLIEVTLTQALALAKQGDMVTAVPLFQRTLTLAEPGGYVRLFLDQQEASLARLLHHVAGNGVTTEYARSLLVHLDPTAVIEETIIQPLSGRELETLQYLAEGLTNREISQRMVVSINTVKAHTRRLYQKLNVNNRTQAVGRARDLQLL